MKMYEVPLRIVEGDTSHEDFAAAHMLYDCMTPEELTRETTLNDEELDAQNRPSYYFEILGMDMSDRLANIDTEEEIENQPKNYGVALAGAMGGHVEAAKKVMEYLMDLSVYGEPLDKSIFEPLDISWEEIGTEPTNITDTAQLDLDRFEEIEGQKRSGSQIVDEVYDMYLNERDSVFPPTERGVKFLLGHRLQREDSNVLFEVGPAGVISARYDISPDIDVLEMDSANLRVGYEVKGFRKGGELSKGQLYRGLGQALALLSQPSDVRDGVLVDKSYLAYPRIDNYSTGLDETWLNSFQSAVSETPVGIIEVDLDGYEVIRTAESNPVDRSKVDLDLDAVHPNSIRHPENGVMNMGRKIKEEMK